MPASSERGSVRALRPIPPPISLEQSLFQVVSRTAPLVGDAYFAGLVQSLTDVFRCTSAFVIERTRRNPQGLRPVAVVSGGTPCRVGDYSLETSAALTSLSGAAAVHNNATETYPADAVVAVTQSEHVIITSVCSADGTPNGFLGIGDPSPFDDALTIEAILRLVGPRVGAEIERMQASAELKEQAGMFREFMDNAEDIVLRTYPGENPVVDYVNPAFESFMGYPIEDLYADPQLLLRIAHPDDREGFAKMLLGRDTGQRLLWRWIHRDGSIVWTEGKRRHIYDDSGKLIALESIVRNVTAQKEAEQRAAEAERVARLVIAAIPDTVVCVDRHGVVTRPPGAQPDSSLLGTFAESAKLGSLLPADISKAVMRALGSALASSTTETVRFTAAHAEHDLVYEARIVPADDERAIVFFRDITGEEFLSNTAERERSKDELEVKAERRILRSNPYGLTFREYTVLELMARGLTDKQIAAELGISLNTVGKHVSNVLGKMQVSSRTEASVHAVQQHLLD